MKSLIIAFVLLGISSTAAAQFQETSINYIQMAAEGDRVFVYLQGDEKISHAECDNPDVDSIGGLVIHEANARFEELYAALLIAKHNDATIRVLHTTGTCSNNFWLVGPYIRF